MIFRKNFRTAFVLLLSIFYFFSAHGNNYTSELRIYKRDSVYIAKLNSDSQYGKKGMYMLLNTENREILPHAFEQITLYKDDIYALKLDNKVGLCDIKGKMVLDVEYTGIAYLIDNFYQIRKDNKWGIFDMDRREVLVAPQYSSIRYMEGEVSPQNVYILPEKKPANRMALVSKEIEGDNSIALLDLKTGKENVPFGKYNHIIYSDKYEFMRVSTKSGWEILDYQGQKYLSSDEYYDADISPYGFITTDSNRKKGFVSLQGDVLKPAYSEVRFANNGMGCVMDNSAVEKYGAIDSTGKLIIPTEYHYMYISDTYFQIVKKGKFGIADFNGKILYSCKYDNVEYFPEGDILVAENNDKVGLFAKGKPILPMKCRNIYYSSGVARICDSDNKWGVYVLNKKKLIKPKYDNIEKFVNGVAVISNHNSEESQYGLMDSTGKEIVKPTYNAMFFNNNQTYATVRLGKNHGMIGAHGEIVVPLIFKGFKDYKTEDNSSGIAIVQREDKYGAYNFHKKKELLAPIYDEIILFSSKIGFRYSIEGKYGFADIEGKTIIEPRYSSIGALYPVIDNFKVGLNGKYGIVDIHDNMVIPNVYNSIFGIQVLGKYYLIVNKDDKYGILDLLNNKIIDFNFDKIEYDRKLNHFIAKQGEVRGVINIGTKQFVPE